MKKFFTILGSIIAGGLSMVLSVTPQSAEAGTMMQ